MRVLAARHSVVPRTWPRVLQLPGLTTTSRLAGRPLQSTEGAGNYRDLQASPGLLERKRIDLPRK